MVLWRHCAPLKRAPLSYLPLAQATNVASGMAYLHSRQPPLVREFKPCSGHWQHCVHACAARPLQMPKCSASLGCRFGQQCIHTHWPCIPP